MVEPEAGANHGLPTSTWRPRDCQARIDVAVVRAAETGAHSAKTLRSTGGEIEGIGAVQHFVKNIEKAVTRPHVEGHVRPPLKLILEVAVILGLAQAVDGQGAVQSSRAYL